MFKKGQIPLDKILGIGGIILIANGGIVYFYSNNQAIAGLISSMGGVLLSLGKLFHTGG